ncbi:uncharacterized protein MELLADRAFT_53696 [Melampsora larici-populina 98AG31]|uniref:ENTH domain-containing protein n=1 Tax=Melampsora larici-populina (strain 98AG31 / pathotype 3-4-7) TaxID=747676 RepID=F4S2U1_MELLP|nr:uncharacterized protein MELLADRAFT_53696 [Melampsora larici-populina 98AG31]EGG01069.1 hypothetical protein MELLADRAFT_53696 [Melampsora larici-populina 98AG31]
MSGIGNMGKHALRVAKNYTKGYSDTQTKVRTATSNDPWGPSGTQMNEVATLTFNQQDFIEIMEMMDKRLNDKGKNWRHVFKALTLLDYLLHAGSENVVLYFRENVYIIKTLKEFQYIDEYGKDQGANGELRQKAKDISNLLMDEARLQDERRSRAHMRDRMTGRRPNSSGEDDAPRRAKSVPPARQNNEDSELNRALELSRLTAAEEAERLKKKPPIDPELEEAMRLSREEEANRRKLDPNASALFDDGYDMHNNNQNQQPDLIDMSMPVQPTGLSTSKNSCVHSKWNNNDSRYMEEQAQYEAMMQQQMYLQQQQQQQQQFIMAQHTAAPIQPQMTSYGSNNPFAQFSQPPSFSQPSVATPPPRAPSAPPSSSFNFNDYANLSNSSNHQQHVSPPMPVRTASNAEAFKRPPMNNPPPPKDDGQHAKLAALLAAGGGVDTFGNEGSMRVPVGSPFHPSNRVAVQKTGGAPNPFGNQSTNQPNNGQPENPFFTI